MKKVNFKEREATLECGEAREGALGYKERYFVSKLSIFCNIIIKQKKHCQEPSSPYTSKGVNLLENIVRRHVTVQLGFA